MPIVKKKRTFSIKQVAKLLNIPVGTLRQWEKDFHGLIIIPRTKQGARYYTEKEIHLLEKVKEMREKNISKEMIRTLLEKYLQQNQGEENLPAISIVSEQPPSLSPQLFMQGFQQLLEDYKEEIIEVIRKEVRNQQEDIVNEVKKEVATNSLHTIKELSKSIQRANHKRQGEFQVLTDTIEKTSRATQDELGEIHHQIWQTSKTTIDNINRKITETIQKYNRDNKLAVKKASQTINEAAANIYDLKEVVKEDREYIHHTLSHIKNSIEEIEQREEAFQILLQNFREAAPTKGKKRRWRFWLGS